jgi:hypothetical protein
VNFPSSGAIAPMPPGGTLDQAAIKDRKNINDKNLYTSFLA